MCFVCMLLSSAPVSSSIFLSYGPSCGAARSPDMPPEGWLQKTLAGGGSAVVLAFLCNKALFVVRTPITIAVTPAIARCASHAPRQQ